MPTRMKKAYARSGNGPRWMTPSLGLGKLDRTGSGYVVTARREHTTNSGGEFFGEQAQRVESRFPGGRVQQALDECRTDDHAVGERRHFGRLSTGRHPEADRDRPAGVRPDPG